DHVYAQKDVVKEEKYSGDHQMPSLSLPDSYSDLPMYFGDELSNLNSYKGDLEDSVKEKILPHDQRTPSSKTIDDIILDDLETVGEEGKGESTVDSATSNDMRKSIYVVDYQNTRIQKFNDNGDFVLKWGDRGKEDGQ